MYEYEYVCIYKLAMFVPTESSISRSRDGKILSCAYREQPDSIVYRWNSVFNSKNEAAKNRKLVNDIVVALNKAVYDDYGILFKVIFEVSKVGRREKVLTRAEENVQSARKLSDDKEEKLFEQLKLVLYGDLLKQL